MVDAKSNDDSTPLMHTSGMGHDDLVACLIKDAGADAGHKNNIDSTAMHYATGGGHTSVVNILAQHGVDVKVKANGGEKPIHHAAMHGHAETLSNLIHLGADAGHKDNIDSTAMHYASVWGHSSVVNTLSNQMSSKISSIIVLHVFFGGQKQSNPDGRGSIDSIDLNNDYGRIHFIIAHWNQRHIIFNNPRTYITHQ